MSTVIEKVRLIFVEADVNSNKYWEGRLYDNGDVSTHWGRVGKDLQTKMFPGGGKRFLEKKKAEKLNKGYEELKTVETDSTQTKTVDNGDLSNLAKKQIKVSSPELSKLIDRLIRSNIHKITSATTITFNAVTGLFSTPLGIVTPEGVTEAREILADIKKNIQSESALKSIVSKYLRLVPHDIGMRFDIRAIFPDDNAIQKENDILDALEASYAALSSAPKTTSTSTTKEENIFEVELGALNPNDPEYKRINSWYTNSNKPMHGYTNIKIVNIYKVNIGSMSKAYRSNNDKEVFHGTSEANLLSILKSGLKVSPPSTAYIAGKMWGNGIYGAIHSSKSLGYTLGRWGGSRTNTGWLFVCDFAMGNIDYPKGYGGKSRPSSGYDSIWATVANTGLHHDELIVYKDHQVKIKYLIEAQ